jgi:multidrug efflux pump
VSGSFESELDIANVNFAVGGRMLRLADIATVRRGYSDPPQPMFRVNGTPAIGLPSPCATAATSSHWARTSPGGGERQGGTAARHRADPRRRPGGDRRDRVSEFMSSLWQAVASSWW